MVYVTVISSVSDALNYVNGKAEKLVRESDKMSIPDEEEKEDYQTTVTEQIETEGTTNYSSSESKKGKFILASLTF